ncbi:hypothetical protein Daus18300_012124 [Diaporthe australafricana]|uniref:Uncharacterized protein n=1 Tax=Diaporthe australafricana TaxID=127596 RepID=A0ABR3W408_9PEZI
MTEATVVQISHPASKQSNNPFGKAIQGIAATIGLASETIHYHKHKRASQQFQRNGIPKSVSSEDLNPTIGLNISPPQGEAELEHKLPTQVDEIAWAFDEVQEDINTNSSKTVTPHHTPPDSPKLGESFLQSHTFAMTSPMVANRLDIPVVITQRRPKARTRGFIRAYAPNLQKVGIDQDTFIDFIDQLNKAVEPSPWITAIDLASLAGHAFPEPVHLLISASALMATQITAEVVSRSKSNAFLDRMNNDFFKPKGLIALVVTWKPKKDDSEQNPTGMVDIDMTATAASKITAKDPPASMKRRKSMIQLPSSGSMFELPEFAPLVFPKLETTSKSPEPLSPVSPSHKRAVQGMQLEIPTNSEQQLMSKPTNRARSRSIGEESLVQRAEAGCLPAFRHSTAEYVGPAVRQVKLGGKSAGSSVKRTGSFISDYQDRRAVARWSGRHPDSQMAKLAPAPEFKSKFADPNHPVGSGDFVALVTGGKHTTAEVSRDAVRATAAASREGMMRVKSTAEGAGLRVGGNGGGDGGDGEALRRIISPRAKEALLDIRPRGDWVPKLPQTAAAGVAPTLRRIGSLQLGNPVRTMKKLLQPDILYLMIVNLPTEEEIANAAACLNQVNEESRAEGEGVEDSRESKD